MFKLIILTGLCAIAAWSQTTGQQMKIKLDAENSFGPVGITAAMAGPMSTIPGAPYSAQAVTQRIQMLADGNRIVQSTTNNVARDSKGRVRREESLPAPGGNVETPHLVLIEDIVSGEHITLDANSKTATKLTMFNAKKEAEVLTLRRGSDTLALPAVEIMTMRNGKPDHVTTATTDLGTQTIEGVIAKGTKTARTIPAGELGNDLPIVITTETWMSPDLKVIVMSKSSDPRMGETTYKLTNLSRAEPDPSLFLIPADYTVKDQPAKVFVYKSADK